MTFDQSTVLVTGAGSGIGRETALLFARDGARVCITDIDLVAAEATAHAAGRGAMALRLDVTCEDEVSGVFGVIAREWGGLDYAFNNAGIRGNIDMAHEMTLAAFRSVYEINVVGVFLCLRAELGMMYQRGSGAIVNMASIAGFVTTPGSAHYTASKHAVIGLTKNAALEAAPHGVRVNAIAPGTVETPLSVALAGSPEAMRQRYAPAYPLGRLGQPAEIAEAVLWLCDRRASFVTGHTLVVDGGMLVR